MNGFAHPWSSFPYMYNVRAPQKLGREEDWGQKPPGYQWVSYWGFQSKVQHCYLLAFSFSMSLSFNMSTQSAGQLYPLRAWCRDTIKVAGSPVTMTTTWEICECYWQSIMCNTVLGRLLPFKGLPLPSLCTAFSQSLSVNSFQWRIRDEWAGNIFAWITWPETLWPWGKMRPRD